MHFIVGTITEEDTTYAVLEPADQATADNGGVKKAESIQVNGRLHVSERNQLLYTPAKPKKATYTKQ